MHHYDLLTFALLFLSAVFAATVDTISGGGGLITVPVLLGIGLPPVVAFGTNKLQSAIGESVAVWRFAQHKHLSFKQLKSGLIYVLVGASGGALLVQYIHPLILSKLIPFLLLVLLLYTIFKPRLGKEDIQQRLSESVFYLIFGLGLGFYNGFFGPATGSFWVFALMFFLGFNMQKASIHMKPLNLAGNLISLLWFFLAGKIAYLPALVMSAGQIIGAQLGSHLVLSKGTRLIRPVFIVVVSLMTIDLFLKNYL